MLFLLVMNLNYSQNSKIKFGVQAGLNYSTLYGYNLPPGISSVFSEKPTFAYLGGLHLEYQLKEKLSLKLELNYERKGQKGVTYIELTDTNGFGGEEYNFTVKKNYDYLILPLMVKYNFTNKNSFYFNGGPFIGYLLKSNLTNDLVDIEGLENDSDTTTNLNKRTDFGLSVGFGKTFEFNKNSIFIEIRENLGLTNTSKTKFWENGEAKTNSLNLIIGYSLN